MEGIVKPSSILENTDERILRIEEGMPKGILKNPDSLNEKKIKKPARFNDLSKRENDDFLNRGILDSWKVTVDKELLPDEDPLPSIKKEVKEKNINDRLKNEKTWKKEFRNENNPGIFNTMKNFIMPNKKKLELKRNTYENEKLKDPELTKLNFVRSLKDKDAYDKFKKYLKNLRNFDEIKSDYEVYKNKYEADLKEYKELKKMKNNDAQMLRYIVDKKYQLQDELNELMKKEKYFKELRVIKETYEKPDREYFLIRNHQQKEDVLGNVPPYAWTYKDRTTTRKGGKRHARYAKDARKTRKVRKSKKTRKVRKIRKTKNNKN